MGLSLMALASSGVFGAAQADSITRYQIETLRRLEDRWSNRTGSQRAWDLGTATGQNWRNGSFTSDQSRYVTVLAACDSDCSSIELRVQDYRGVDVNTAAGGTGTSELGFNAEAGQTYKFWTRAVDCRESYCWLATSVIW